MSTSKLIDGDKLAAIERWKLPGVNDPRAPRSRIEEAEADVRPLTAEQIEVIEKQAYEEGFALGRKEGLEAGQSEIVASVRHLQHLIQSLAEPLQELGEQVEGEVAALAMAIARQIIRRELQQDPQQIIGVVREAMSALPSAARNIRLYLHPDDAALVRDSVTGAEAEEFSWKIIEDVALTRGGCRVESNNSRIDASVEKRLNALMVELMGGSRVEDDEST
jgi:flagellar assembly protein FliH